MQYMEDFNRASPPSRGVGLVEPSAELGRTTVEMEMNWAVPLTGRTRSKVKLRDLFSFFKHITTYFLHGAQCPAGIRSWSHDTTCLCVSIFVKSIMKLSTIIHDSI